MPGSHSDPFAVLGVSRDAPDAEVRGAYRRLVQLHHPDHNGGSADSTRRFEEVQEAYAEIRRLRQPGNEAREAGDGPAAGGRASGGGPPPTSPDPAVEARLADLERQVRDAHKARERAQAAARKAAAQASSSSSSGER